jgi:hypothetical protein
MNGLDFESFALPGSVLVLLTSLVLVSFRDWRISLMGLTIQYLGVFLLVSTHWPFVMAMTKVVAGWISTAVLAMAVASIPESNSGPPPNRTQLQILRTVWRFFRLSSFQLATAAMIVLVVLSLVPSIEIWIPSMGIADSFGAFTMIGLGLLHLGFTSQPLRIILALLTILSGFEIIYSAVEISTLVAGLLAGVTLGLAMIGAYLLIIESIGVER